MSRREEMIPAKSTAWDSFAAGVTGKPSPSAVAKQQRQVDQLMQQSVDRTTAALRYRSEIERQAIVAGMETNHLRGIAIQHASSEEQINLLLQMHDDFVADIREVVRDGAMDLTETARYGQVVEVRPDPTDDWTPGPITWAIRKMIGK